MATIREWLQSAGFDHHNGVMVVQDLHPLPPIDDTPGYPAPGSAFHDEIAQGRFATWSDPILDHEFDDGLGSPDCPRFIAEDDARFYFPWQYDGATDLTVVEKDLHAYTGDRPKRTPYPGGS